MLRSDGTTWKTENEAVIGVLEGAWRRGTRLRITYGDPVTGKVEHARDYVEGRIARSNGRVKVPLVLHNARSLYGHMLDDYAIVRIETSRGRKLLYQVVPEPLDIQLAFPHT
jgi:hypothetical protein